MALSDHDQTVLREMETALRADTRASNGSRPSVNRRSRYYLSAAIGLFIAGATAMAVGLRLQDDLGTGLGVLGFLFISGSGWSGTHLLTPLREWMTTHHPTAARNPH